MQGSSQYCYRQGGGGDDDDGGGDKPKRKLVWSMVIPLVIHPKTWRGAQTQLRFANWQMLTQYENESLGHAGASRSLCQLRLACGHIQRLFCQLQVEGPGCLVLTAGTHLHDAQIIDLRLSQHCCLVYRSILCFCSYSGVAHSAHDCLMLHRYQQAGTGL